MHACLHSAGTEVVQQLLTHGADPSLEDHSGRSALRYAVEADERDILQVLNFMTIRLHCPPMHVGVVKIISYYIVQRSFPIPYSGDA